MRSLRAVLLVVFASTAAYGLPPRFWFSLEGVPEQAPITGTPEDFFQQANPDILAELGTARLYLWGTTPSPPPIACRILSLDATVYTRAGTVAVTGSKIYNYVVGPDAVRWLLMGDGDVYPDKVDDAWAYALGDAWGFSPFAYWHGDLQYDPETDSMLLGYVDLAMSSDARADIYLGVGDQAFLFLPPQFELFFGWGDETVSPYIKGTESTLADAHIVPEPAAALLLVAAGAAMFRRR